MWKIRKKFTVLLPTLLLKFRTTVFKARTSLLRLTIDRTSWQNIFAFRLTFGGRIKSGNIWISLQFFPSRNCFGPSYFCGCKKIRRKCLPRHFHGKIVCFVIADTVSMLQWTILRTVHKYLSGRRGGTPGICGKSLSLNTFWGKMRWIFADIWAGFQTVLAWNFRNISALCLVTTTVALYQAGTYAKDVLLDAISDDFWCCKYANPLGCPT